MAISYLDLQSCYLKYKNEIDKAIAEVFDSGWFILGEQVKKFEEEFSAYCGCKYGVGVGSGTEALHLSLVSLDIKPGDEVITVPNTAVPTASAISFANAVPVFVDIKSDVYTINPQRIREKINSKTKAIIPVHLYGQSADMDPIMQIAQQYGIPVLEDACQAHGALYKGKKTGSFGKLGSFSFYPSKNLGAYGDGGMIVTNDEELHEKLIKIRNYGETKKYYHSIKGFNSRLDEIQAAVLRVKLKYLDQWNERRREIAELYNSLLKDTPVIVPKEDNDNYHIYHLYVIRVKERDALQEYLENKGIKTLIHYPVPIHLQEAYKELNYALGYLPVAEKTAKEILSLPLYPEIENDTVKAICTEITDFFS